MQLICIINSGGKNMEKFNSFNVARKNEASCSRYFYHPHGQEKDWIIMTIADMDFNTPKQITDAICKEISKQNLVYAWGEKQIPPSINKWMHKHHRMEVGMNQILWANGVIQLMQYAIQALSNEGDGIIIQTPVYSPFYAAIEGNKRKVVENKLVRDGDTFKINFDDLDKKMQDNKLMIMCTPHNPIGRVWTKEELSMIVELAKKNNVKIISDAIWQDLAFTDYVLLNDIDAEWSKNNEVYLTSISKTFNCGGTQHGYAIIRNEEMLCKIWECMDRSFHVGSLNRGNTAMLECAYNDPSLEVWLSDMKKVLKQNHMHIKNTLEKMSKGKIKVIEQDGLFVGLIDFTGLGKTKDELDTMLDKAKVGLSSGEMFGEGFELYKRINYAFAPSVIEEVCKRIVDQIN